MIYILTGVAKSGKTYASKKLCQKYHLQLIQTDHIMMMLSKGNQKLGLDIHASDASVSLFLEPYLLALIETIIQQKGDFLIEGVHFLPSFARRLADLYPQHLRILFLVYEHINPKKKAAELLNHLEDMENPWFKEMTMDELNELCSYLKNESNRIRQACEKHQLDYLEIDDINQQMDQIANKLLHLTPKMGLDQ